MIRAAVIEKELEQVIERRLSTSIGETFSRKIFRIASDEEDFLQKINLITGEQIFFSCAKPYNQIKTNVIKKSRSLHIK